MRIPVVASEREPGGVDRIRRMLTQYPGAAELQVCAGTLEGLVALVDSLPKCFGRWTSGSGGHMRFSHDCQRIATYWDEESSLNEYACDEHKDRIEKAYLDEFWWADAIRKLGL